MKSWLVLENWKFHWKTLPRVAVLLLPAAVSSVYVERDWGCPMDRKTKILMWLTACHAVFFMMAPILSLKVGHLLGLNFLAGTLLLGLTYMITDVVNNNWGKAEARFVVTTSVGSRAIMFLCIMPLIVAIPTVAAFPQYNQVVWGSSRLFIAGEISMFFTQYFMEIPFFAWLRKRIAFTASYSVAGLLNVAVSALVFGAIAFWGLPGFKGLLVGQWVAALAIRLVALPLASALNIAVGRLLTNEGVTG